MSNIKQSVASVQAPPIAKVFVSVLSLLLLITVVLWLIADKHIARAVFLGGGIAIVAHAYFAWQAFRNIGATHAQQIISNFSRGEQGKFAIVAVGFAIVFISNPAINGTALLTAFIGFYFLYSFFVYRHVAS